MASTFQCSSQQTGIHAVEIGCKKCCLGPAGAGADLDDGIAIFAGFRRQEGDLQILLEFSDPLLECRKLRGRQFGHFGIFTGRQRLASASSCPVLW